MKHFIITNPELFPAVRCFETFKEAKAVYDYYVKERLDPVLATSVDTTPPAQFTVVLNKMIGCFVPKTRWTACKTVSLPFVPALHMTLVEHDFVIDKVVWSNDAFYCECDSVRPIVDGLGELDTLITDMKRDGWELS